MLNSNTRPCNNIKISGKVQCMHIGCHFTYIENPKYFIKSILKLITEFSKVAGYIINTQKSVAFLYTYNSQFKWETKTEIRKWEKNPIYSRIKKDKILRNKLNQEGKRLYPENYKALLKEIKINENISYANVLGDWIL